MKITKELIKERFDEYNQIYFSGVLGKCRLYGVLGHGRRFRREARRLKEEFGIDINTRR